ncbi:spermidine synthase [Agromyces aerolatus]|uniref:spermidine synthase n=1 Tax=Agromyces sp. LY-1074 TaxID=3074080 RepID=UPI002854842F|nr:MULTISPECIES: fused MFS/spermidine synthase [unclassified Agromyces]MDR5698435.1 fused MFS/spermidine synthase [Agromyces sp. LY-1074]MDR5704729.1 fused MFS/spermidine synthase [Agromyces sp. LY-1358]
MPDREPGSDLERRLGVSGHLARLEESRSERGAWTLYVDDTPQSHVELERPDWLGFEYVRRIGHAVDVVAPEGAPVTALHLGAGALTLPRYVAATRPGSRQQVVELEADLVELVRRHLPLPRGAQIRVRTGDAREVLAKLPAGLDGAVDVAIVDIFSGARTPAHVTSAEFYGLLVPRLAPGGLVAVNVADGAGLAFARSQAATLAHVFAHVAIAAPPTMLKGRRVGNVVIFASADPLPFDTMPRRLAADPAPAKLVEGDELHRFIAGAHVATDATAVPSPPPNRSVFLSR